MKYKTLRFLSFGTLQQQQKKMLSLNIQKQKHFFFGLLLKGPKTEESKCFILYTKTSL